MVVFAKCEDIVQIVDSFGEEIVFLVIHMAVVAVPRLFLEGRFCFCGMSFDG